MYLDTVNTRIDTSVPPAVNGTGGLAAKGTVTGLNFLANGSGAGTSDWVAGSPLPLCSQGTPFTQPQPCIQQNSFFLQAPSGTIANSLGWTAPSLPNTLAEGPLIVGMATNTSGPYASTLTYGTLTDSSSSTPELATVTGGLTVNHLVSIANPSGSNYDLVDAGIALSAGSVIPYANETIPTFDSTGTGLTSPAGNAAFTFPNAATSGFSLSGTAPSSSSGAGTNAMPLFTANGVPGGATSSTGTAAGGVGSSPIILGGAGGNATGSGTTSTIGGAGGGISLTAGAGGTGNLGNDSGGNGGNITLTPGAGGSAHGTGNSGFAGIVQANGLIQSSNTAKVLGGDYTNSTGTAGTIVGSIGIGLTWTLPPSSYWSFNCNFAYNSNITGTGSLPKLALSTLSSVAPISEMATGEIWTNVVTTTTLVSTATVTSTSTSVAVLTGSLPANSAIGYVARLYGTIETNSSTASTFSIQAVGSGGTGTTNTIKVLRGSYCELF